MSDLVILHRENKRRSSLEEEKKLNHLQETEHSAQAEPVNRTEELKKKFFTDENALLKGNDCIVRERREIGTYGRSSCAVIVRNGDIIARFL